jgi:hypothetical protein
VQDLWDGVCCCTLVYQGAVFVGLDAIVVARETLQTVKTALTMSACGAQVFTPSPREGRGVNALDRGSGAFCVG